MPSQYYSQYAQDLLLNEVLFKGKQHGFFLDIGAHDGVTLSNSYFFEKEMGWTGICVEPIPEVFARLQQNRVATLINACITDTDGEIAFTRITGYSEMLSGITKQQDEKHLDRINREIAEKGGSVEQIVVAGISLRSLFIQQQVTLIDFVSIDTEGNELPIIESFPFDLVQPKIFLVENNNKDNTVKNLLAKQGYQKIIKAGDDFFYRGNVSAGLQWRLLLFRIKRMLKMVGKR